MIAWNLFANRHKLLTTQCRNALKVKGCSSEEPPSIQTWATSGTQTSSHRSVALLSHLRDGDFVTVCSTKQINQGK